jgi:hypothetical protein
VQSTKETVGLPMADAAVDVLVHAPLAWPLALAMIEIQ